MAKVKFSKDTLNRWIEQVDHFFMMHPTIFKNAGLQHRIQVSKGVDAWAIADRAGILKDAYKDRTVVDAHIQTALQCIFPAAVFKDKKRY